MKRKLLVSFACVALAATAMVALPGVASSQNSLTIDATVEGNVVTVTVTIQDTGGAPDCGSFHLVRTTLVYSEPATETRCIPRTIGTTTTHQFIDTLPPNRAFHYTVVGMMCFAPCVCISQSDQDVFNSTFSPWGLGIHAYVDTGPAESTPIAHGRLWSTGFAYPTHSIEGCPGTEDLGAFASPDALPYVDTGIELLVYGSAFFDVQNGPMVSVTSVVPWTCEEPVGVDPRSWGSVKALYR